MAESDHKARRLALRRRQRAAAAPAVSSSSPAPVQLTDKQRAEPLRGWYACCVVFYVGFGRRKLPPCPRCAKPSRKALTGEVYDAG